jgi:hypothetical protein
LGLKAWLALDEIFSEDIEEVYHDGQEVHGQNYENTFEEVV